MCTSFCMAEGITTSAFAPGLTREEFHRTSPPVLYPVAPLERISTRYAIFSSMATPSGSYISVRAGQCHHLGPSCVAFLQMPQVTLPKPAQAMVLPAIRSPRAPARSGDGIPRRSPWPPAGSGCRRKAPLPVSTVLPRPLQPPVLAEEDTRSPGARPCPRRHVHIRPDVPVQRLHVRLAEPA